MSILYPPIIDSTSSAFVITEACEVSFYFNNQEDKVNSQKIKVRVQDALGQDLLIGGEQEYSYEDDYSYASSESLTKIGKRYQVRILGSHLKGGTFQLNTRYIISLD